MTATRTSCHEARHSRESLPHSRWPCKQSGCPMSSDGEVLEDEFYDPVNNLLGQGCLDQRSVVPFAVYLVGLRGQYLVHRITLVRGWSACLSRRLVHILCKLGLSSGPPGGRPRARLKAGTPREAPTPAPTTSHRPHNSYPTPYEGRNNAESTNLQNHRRGGKS